MYNPENFIDDVTNVIVKKQIEYIKDNSIKTSFNTEDMVKELKHTEEEKESILSMHNAIRKEKDLKEFPSYPILVSVAISFVDALFKEDTNLMLAKIEAQDPKAIRILIEQLNSKSADEEEE